jgi:diguanylate cyclase (GGDEF)-like protein
MAKHGSAQASGGEQGQAIPFPGRLSLQRIAEPNTALALLFLIGGGQAALIIWLPHWYIDSPDTVLVAGLAGILTAPIVWLTRRVQRSWSRQILLLFGTAATTLAVFGCGAQQSTISASYFYFLVVLYAAAYFRPVAVISHLSIVGASYAAVLALNPRPVFPAQWLQAMLMLSITAVMVGGFAARIRHAAAAMSYQAFHDPLTGLANRARFIDCLEEALARPDHDADRIAMLLLDLDDFREVNDSLGHPAGDQVLVTVARRLDSIRHAGDTLARLGGDEFALLLEPSSMLRTAEAVAAQIAVSLDEPIVMGGSEVTVSCSIGIVQKPDDRDMSDDVLRDADLAMYLAKTNGKGRFETFRPGMQDEALDHLSLMTDLRRALQRNQFELFYQPIVAVATGRSIGAEALLRWRHPRRGLVPPGEFIGPAESAGLIVAIGDWVLNEACRQAQEWRMRGIIDDSFYISVNVSPRQLSEPTLVDWTARALRVSGLPADALVLEITESALMSNFTVASERLEELHGLGVRLALDDYGTGYSSLSRLRQLPVDIVKIDKSFIDDVAQTLGGQALVRSVIDVTRALGMVSIAEGVELTAQYLALEDLGCDAIQGYIVARPAPSIDIGHTLRRLSENDNSFSESRTTPVDVPADRRRSARNAPVRDIS